ncbi:MAG: response regulator [Pseudomonadota bacterium]|nr:response regulator [Pseudomonadota bacterium]
MIILCEDNADQSLALRFALEHAGYVVREAPDAPTALALQRKQRAPVLITDLFMPDMDGFELIAAFKSEFPDTKIVVISANRPESTMNYLASADLMGVDATLQKPFEVTALLAILDRMTKQAR